jgi:aspartate/methionine/tyrosine aminotransferase
VKLNPIVDVVSAPPVPAVQAWRRAYDGGRGPLIDLSQAVPGYPPHPDMLRWLGEAGADAGLTGYGPIPGEDALRAAYAGHVAELYGASVEAGNVHVTAGCNQAFIAAIMALARSGDTVALANPFYFNHDTSLALLGIKTSLVETRASNGFVPTPEAVADALAKGARVMALVSPNNPTGAVYPADVLDRIFDACREAGAWLVLDETYRDFLPPGSGAPHRLFARPGWEDGFVSLYSFSKSYCIPGHRVGAVTAGPRVVEAVAKIMDNLQICPPRPAQAALAKAIPALGAWREANRAEIAERGEAMRAAFEGLTGWELSALGAYFAFVRHPMGGSSLAAAERLTRERGVLTIPGAFFGPGQDGYLRFAFANADAAGIAALRGRLSVLA